ncbi:MAG: DUF4172 domain-containing protein, partial [Bryobacterales bacterium]|nr:DUF4172 domain-containing protein [Bryobacterales bacterium]
MRRLRAVISAGVRRMYLHELEDWPKFHWSAETIAAPLATVRDRQTRLIRQMEALGFNLQQEAVL